MALNDILVRDAGPDDMDAIARIYAHEVLHGLSTFEEVPPQAEEMNERRLAVIAGGFPYLVAQRDNAILGYSYAHPYHARPAYRNTIENSVYVAKDAHRQGVGRSLLAELIKRCEAGGWRQMIAVIGNSENNGSIELHRTLGFEMVGTLQATGFKLGRWVDTVYMQRALGSGSNTKPDSKTP